MSHTAIRTVRMFVSAAILGAGLAASPVMAQDNKVVARIDGMDITEQEIALAGEDLGERIAQVPAAQRRDYLIGYLSDLKIGARAAERAKITEAPEFALRLAYFRQKVLMDEFIARQSKIAATPEAARKLFDDAMKTMKPDQEVRARHILVEKEDEAKAALARVRSGEDFAKVAAELSKDPGSGKEGGDLGYFTQDRMVPQFGAMAFQLKPGEVSEPVQTQFGWHVIRVEDKRDRPLPRFEDVKGEIETYLMRKAQQDIVLSLRGDLKLERLDQPKP
ncbi:MAG: peptidylprolyl isomerase [Bosea sp.]|jgi:peptidyl-prolyl cis-trans isomerase C|nr:peptidylprolyl isomerase [Bosea sp. (in: a-proteobacteria)]